MFWDIEAISGGIEDGLAELAMILEELTIPFEAVAMILAPEAIPFEAVAMILEPFEAVAIPLEFEPALVPVAMILEFDPALVPVAMIFDPMFELLAPIALALLAPAFIALLALIALATLAALAELIALAPIELALAKACESEVGLIGVVAVAR
jgi:hypothetical protein